MARWVRAMAGPRFVVQFRLICKVNLQVACPIEFALELLIQGLALSHMRNIPLLCWVKSRGPVPFLHDEGNSYRRAFASLRCSREISFASSVISSASN
jgi:hypothetical protein